jgi:predicted nucleic acid-binding protein
MAILDTTFLIDVLRNKESALALRRKLTGDALIVPTPAIMELWAGALNSKLGAAGKRQVEELLATMTVANFEIQSAKRAAELKIALRNEPIDTEDFMIAGIALSRGDQVVTRDEHYARIPGLRVLKY